MMNLYRLLPVLALLFGLGACNPTKHLPEGERLYTGAKIEVNGLEKKQRKALATELSELARPKPNTNVLGIRYKLYFWNLVDTPKKRGVKSWLKRKFGEPPVLASEVKLEKNREIMQSRLVNRGYFHGLVAAAADTSGKGRYMKAVYTATPGEQYFIRNVTYPDGTDSLSVNIQRIAKRRELLKPGAPYSLDRIKAVRTRIDQILKQRGFYYFNPEALLVEVDSTVGDHKVDLNIVVKDDVTPRSLEQFRIRKITVYPNFDLEESLSGDTTGDQEQATLTKEGYYIADPQHHYRKVVFSKTLMFKPYDLYNRRDHNTSLNRMVNLGTFKFVKAEFTDVDTPGNFLDVDYYATPQPRKTLGAQVLGLTRSNNSTGSELSLSWRHRNFFGGAEQFSASVYGGLESQIYGQQNVTILRYGSELNLTLPRILSPIPINTRGEYVPQTRFTLGYEHYNRTDLYSLNTFKGQYGYSWKPEIRKEHQLTLININVVDSSQITDSFRRLLAINPVLQRSITRQLIIGSMYNYNYNTNARSNRLRHNYFFNGNVEGAGNLLGLLTGASAENPVTIQNIPFSQYLRGEVDFRHYWRLNTSRPANDITLVSRLFAGAGYAYGNRPDLPFIKQFFSGGVNSIRAFRARSVGPGTYEGGSYTANGITYLADQPGDIRFEFNNELRFPIYSFIKGAVFVDAGNVWSMREDSTRPGAEFTSKFLSQLAVGAGVGLRFDISFLVIRADLSTPIRRPGNQSVDYTFGNPEYRRQNLIINLAIGYPF
ncbi:MAG: hypothetical protein EOP52_02310 [Sphingobacteriales bacterium]|nr:MAG: hypothetical protein EOP52_02310 [Sphingobacteriales bacterium]